MTRCNEEIILFWRMSILTDIATHVINGKNNFVNNYVPARKQNHIIIYRPYSEY